MFGAVAVIDKKNPAKFGRELSINQGASTYLLSWGCYLDPESFLSNIQTIFDELRLQWLGLWELAKFR